MYQHIKIRKVGNKMKIFLTILTCVIMLSSCETIKQNLKNNADIGQELDIKLTNEKNIFETLNAFYTHYTLYTDDPQKIYARPQGAEAVILSTNRKQLCCDFFANYTKKISCDINYGKDFEKSCEGLKEICEINDEDECKLYLRNNKNTSMIAYFNYKKYLPEGVANSEPEFLALYHKFDDIFIWNSNNASSCIYNSNLTQKETQQCNEQAQKDFVAWAMSGGARNQIKEKIKLTRIAEQKKKEQQAIQKAKTEAQKADCKQAIEKAQQRLKQIKTALGMNVNEKNLFYNLTGKVVDFANNGVIISTDCSSIWANGWMFGDLGILAANNCKEERTFIYTKNTDYATNEKFNNKGLLYKKAGNFRYTTIMGSTMSIPAYKETQYKASEISYKTYLKDKTIKSCE